MLTKALRLLVIPLIVLAYAMVFGQGATAWKIADDPGGKVLFAKTDMENHIYAVVQDPSGVRLRIYDKYGALITSYSVPGATTANDLLVASDTGTAVVVTDESSYFFEWDGSQEAWGFGNEPPDAYGIDPSGRMITIIAFGTYGLVNANDTYGIGLGWNAFVPVSSAFVDAHGSIVLLGKTGTVKSGSNTVNAYTEEGYLVYSTSYATSLTQSTSVGGFLAGIEGFDYLILNTFNVENGHSTSVQTVGNGQPLSSTVAGSPVAFCTDGSTVYVENGTSLSAIAMQGQGAGTVRWTKPRVATALGSIGSGVVALQYNASNSTVELWQHDKDTGNLISSLSLGQATADQVGGLLGTSTNNVIYFGATAAGSLLAQMAYGPALTSIIMPASIVGGNYVSAQLNFNAVAVNAPVNPVSSNPAVLTPVSSLVINGQSFNTSWPTSAVDVDTVVKIFANQTYPLIQKTATVKVTTATLPTFLPVLSTLNPPQTTTATATLNGAAGPSGKTIALSSSNSAIALPASLHINAGLTSGSVTITSHPVAVDTTVTLKATLGALSQTALVVVKAPVLTGLKLSSSSIIGGNSATGTATFSAQPAAGQTMLVGSSLPVVATAAPSDSVNSTSVAFPITTHGDSANATSVISVTFGSITFHQNLIVGPAALASAVLSQTQVKGGTSVTFTLTLNGQAPSTGGTAQFGTSNSALATGPASIKFADDGTSAVVTITTKPVTTQQTVTLSATYLGVTKSQVLTVTP